MQDNNFPVWPGWTTVRLIGRGSFGAVYELERRVFDDVEKAALKVITIPQNKSDIDEMYADGFTKQSITATFKNHLKSIVNEYSIMRKMNGSANVVNCEDVRYIQHDDGIGWDIFIKMELLTPLTKALPDKPDEKTALKLALDMTAALELCEGFSIIHRDIKPQNIFVSPLGDYKLGDFGVAKTVEKTMGGTKIGTYKYMAPEVYNNQPYGTQADIYSLGLVLYWMLNEKRLPFMPLPPFEPGAGADEQARARRLAGEPIPAPKHGCTELKRIVLKACAYDPRDRYRTAAEMRADLEAVKNGVTYRSVSKREQEDDEATVGVIFNSTWKAPPNTRQAPPNTRQTPPNTRQTPPNNRQTPPNNRQTPPNNRQTPPNNRQAPSNTRQKKGRGSTAATIGVIASALAIVVLFITNVHFWAPATCMKREHCKLCGISRGDYAEHKWTVATCTEPKTCSVCGKTSGTPVDHQWLPATCTEPAICALCGAEDGAPLGHLWHEATCTQPKLCADCGLTEGEPLGHQWLAATYDQPKTCSVCGQTEGAVLGYVGKLPFTIGEKENVYGYQSHGPCVMDNTVYDCMGLTLYLKITDYSGSVNGGWYLMGKTEAGKWTVLGSFDISGVFKDMELKKYFVFSDPVTFTALAVCRADNASYDVSYNINFLDAQCRVY